MKTQLLILAALCLSACATATKVPLPDGSEGFVIQNCNDPAECYKKAAQTCGGKYEVVDKSGHSVGALSGGATPVGLLIPEYTMTVRCPDRIAK